MVPGSGRLRYDRARGRRDLRLRLGTLPLHLGLDEPLGADAREGGGGGLGAVVGHATTVRVRAEPGLRRLWSIEEAGSEKSIVGISYEDDFECPLSSRVQFWAIARHLKTSLRTNLMTWLGMLMIVRFGERTRCQKHEDNNAL